MDPIVQRTNQSSPVITANGHDHLLARVAPQRGVLEDCSICSLVWVFIRSGIVIRKSKQTKWRYPGSHPDPAGRPKKKHPRFGWAHSFMRAYRRRASS